MNIGSRKWVFIFFSLSYCWHTLGFLKISRAALTTVLFTLAEQWYISEENHETVLDYEVLYSSVPPGRKNILKMTGTAINNFGSH